AERRRVLREIFAFLGVAEDVDSERFDEELLSDKGDWRAYPPRYARLKAHVVSPMTRWLSPQLRRTIRRRVERRFSPLERPTLDERWRARLEALYGEEVARL